MLSAKTMLQGLRNKKYGLERPEKKPEEKPRKTVKTDAFFLESSTTPEPSAKPKYLLLVFGCFLWDL